MHFIFTFYGLFFLATFFIKGMEEEKITKRGKNIFPYAPLQALCIKSLFSSQDPIALIHSVRKINLLNKKLSLYLYPLIAYEVTRHKTMNLQHKSIIVCFLRDYPKKMNKKAFKVVSFFADFLDKRYYFSTLLFLASENTIKPCIFRFLLEQGEEPQPIIVWHLLGNAKCRPILHRYMLKKLSSLLAHDPLLAHIPSQEPKHLLPGETITNITPLEYVEIMIDCWQDDAWIKGSSIKTYENFSAQLNKAADLKTQKKYLDFFSQAKNILTKHT
jgi:hypothetical protein